MNTMTDKPFFRINQEQGADIIKVYFGVRSSTGSLFLAENVTLKKQEEGGILTPTFTLTGLEAVDFIRVLRQELDALGCLSLREEVERIKTNVDRISRTLADLTENKKLQFKEGQNELSAVLSPAY